MKLNFKKTLLTLFSLVLFAGCAVNPVTGKRELTMVSEAQEIELGTANYAFMQQSGGGEYDVDPVLTKYVQGVGDRLVAVSQERMARQLLQEEVLYLTEELNGFMSRDDSVRDQRDDARPDQQSETTVESRRDMVARRNSPEGRAERLVEAGIAPGLADWIVQREQELLMESLQARYEAGQSGDPRDFFRDEGSRGSTLRDELGEADYERYLAANGRPTNVAIGSVIGSSPAQAVGLLPGDEITRYDGERVFSMTDINLASMDGVAGENVVVDVVRDGIPMQVVLPRGPLGITSSRSRR